MSSQVKRRAAEADEMIRKLAEGANPKTLSDGEQVETPAQPTAEVVEMSPETPQDALDTGEISEQPASLTPIEVEIAELREEARKADARWRSLQGQVDSKDRQIEQLHGLLANLQQAQPEEKAAPEAPVGFTQADTDAFGEDMIDLMSRVAAQKAQEQSAADRQKIAELEAQLAGVTQITASTVQDSFESRLTKMAPDWQELNADQGFINWLSENGTRKQLFDSSAQAKDANGVAEFFNMYATLTAKPQPTNRRGQLEKQVTPGKTRAPVTAAASTPEEKIWSRSEIAEVYKSKGKMSAEEFARLEREISAAMTAQRVDYTR